MVNKKPKKIEKESVPKKKSAVKKKETTVQKKSTVKKVTTAKAKKTAVKKVAMKKPAVKSKPKATSVKKTVTTKAKKPAVKKSAAKKPVKKAPKKITTETNVDLKFKTASKTEQAKVEKVIDKLSRSKEQHYVTTVAGVYRKVPAVQKAATPAHKQLPIAGILNYFKRIF